MRLRPRTGSRSARATARSITSRPGGNAGGGDIPSRLELHHLLALLAQPVDAKRDHVAGLEEFRLRLHAEPDSRRRAGDDDVAWLQHEELRAVPDEVPAIEDHRLGVAALALLSVDVEPHVEALRILDLVLGDQPRAERPECLAALAFDPLSGPLDLEHALAHVVGQAVSGDHVERLVLRQVARALADNDAELHLPVELARPLRDDRVVVRPADAGGHLVEDDRLLGDRHAGLGRVVGIVEPDGDEIADPADAGAEAGIAVHQRQLRDRRLADFRQALGRQRLPRDVRHQLGEIADPPLGIDNSGLLAAARAEANQLHGALSFLVELSSRWRRGADHASAPGDEQASRRERPAPPPMSIIPRCVLPVVRPVRDCCLLATRPPDCSKSGRLYDLYVCNRTLLRTGLPHAPDSRAKLQATRARGATRRRASLPRGLAWLTSQAGRDGAGTCRPCSLLALTSPRGRRRHR